MPLYARRPTPVTAVGMPALRIPAPNHQTAAEIPPSAIPTLVTAVGIPVLRRPAQSQLTALGTRLHARPPMPAAAEETIVLRRLARSQLTVMRTRPYVPSPTHAVVAEPSAPPRLARSRPTVMGRPRHALIPVAVVEWAVQRKNVRRRIIAAGILPHARAVVAVPAAIQTNAVHGSTAGEIRPHAPSIHVVAQVICVRASGRITVAAWAAPVVTTVVAAMETTAPQGAPCSGTAAVAAPPIAQAPTPVIVLELTVPGLAARSPAIAAAKSLNVIPTPAAVAGTCAPADV
jgi:hypothetical protein